MDKSSPAFFEAVHSCTVFPSIELHYVRSGSPVKTFAKTKLSDVVVTHYAERHCGEGLPIESIRLSYAEIERIFVPHEANNESGSQIVTGYNLKTATKK